MKIALLLLTIIPLKAFALDAVEKNVSAYRHLKTDFSFYEKRVLRGKREFHLLRGPSAIRSARIYSDSTHTAKVVSWKSHLDMQERFESIRDERFLITSDDPDFPRRISWLYPKDGCFARAALFNRNAFRMFIPVPNKVFAFGNLRVETNNSPQGVVGWWYHVAPIVQVGNEKFVLDPAIDHEKPLSLKEWLSRMGDPAKIKVAICGSGTYSPGDSCQKETDGMELRAEITQKHYLELEERELRRMGRDPEVELGDTPPWEAQ